jgi:hypothetical protein
MGGLDSEFAAKIPFFRDLKRRVRVGRQGAGGRAQACVGIGVFVDLEHSRHGINMAVAAYQNFHSLLPSVYRTAPANARARDVIVVPEEMGLVRAVAAALETGKGVVVKAGDYELQSPLVVRGKLTVRAEGPVRILGTCVLGGSGHVKGLSFVGQGDDALRVGLVLPSPAIFPPLSLLYLSVPHCLARPHLAHLPLFF